MNLPALIFDHDGTLVDSELLHFRCWREVMSNYGVSVTEVEYIREHNGIPTLRNAEVFIETYSLDLKPHDLCAIKQQHFAEVSRHHPSPLMKLAWQTLQSAHDEGYKMAIATGADKADVERSIAAHEIGHYFDAIATSCEVKRPKPAPDVYLLACEKIGVKPSEAVAFEDTKAGITAAKSAGLVCIAIPNAYSIHLDLSAADARCPSLLDAFALIKKWTRQH